MEWLVGAGVGALGGIVYGLVGYFKEKQRGKEFEGFKWESFLSTVLVAAIIGAAASYTGLTPDALSTSAFGVVVTQLVKKLVNMALG